MFDNTADIIYSQHKIQGKAFIQDRHIHKHIMKYKIYKIHSTLTKRPAKYWDNIKG